MKKETKIVALVAILVIAIIGGYFFPSQKSTIVQQAGQKFGQISDLFTMNRLNVTDISTSQTAVTTTLNGTTTIASSYDGYDIYGAITTSTTSVQTLYTNASSPTECEGSIGFFRYATTAFSPSVVYSIGTSTGALPTMNLLASTTMATSTATAGNTLLALTANSSKFVLNSGDSIIALVGDITNTSASSTYYGNRTAQFKIHCTLLGN